MATPITTVRDFCALLVKSKLLPAGEVETLHQRWQSDTGGGDDQPEVFSKYLVKRHILTHWQAGMVQRGRADGFFLDRYRILDQIGKGQMGGVYKAVHSLGQIVALKILPASRAKDPRVLGRFQREARLLTQLDHPNVVRAFQVGDSGGRHFIAMEFLEGETLDEVINRRKQLPVGEATRLIRQALDGLQHVHEKRMVHRDLKPANMIITPLPARGAPDTTWDGTIKILDVGLGRELFTDADPDGQTATQLTVEGAVVGTPDYMAPEQAKDARTSDIRADIYSLGCVLYHLLTGSPPFPDTSIMAQMLRHATDDPAPLSDHLADAPAGLQEALNLFLAKNPADRHQTPELASRALKRFESTGVGSAPAEASLLPEYRTWLETESHLEMPSILSPSDRPTPTAIPPSPPRKPTGGVKPGTAPAPAIPSSGRNTAPNPAAVPPPEHPAPPYTVGGIPHPTAVPSWQPAARMPPPISLDDEDVEVELVTTLPAAAPSPPPPPVYIHVPDDRALWNLNRRDLFMLVGGGAGVLGALAAGYALSRIVRGMNTTQTEESEEK
jgi:serine/threonine protein kinase